MTGALGVSAIVLAGGRSSRFGRDKLAEPLDGRPLLEHAIDAVTSLADEVLVVVARSAAASPPAGITVVHDAADFEGPLVGLVTGLNAATGSRCLVVGGDMPTLQPTVLAALLAALDDPAVDVALLEHARDVPPLPMAIRRSAAIGPLQQAIAAGERRLRAVRELLAPTIVPEAEWRPLDPKAATLTDIDTPADLPRDST